MSRSRGFIAIEALVGLFISISSCLVLIMSFQNMNNFLIRQRDAMNADLAFIKLKQTEKSSLTIDGNNYQLSKVGAKYYVENLTKGTKFIIEKK